MHTPNLPSFSLFPMMEHYFLLLSSYAHTQTSNDHNHHPNPHYIITAYIQYSYSLNGEWKACTCFLSTCAGRESKCYIFSQRAGSFLAGCHKKEHIAQLTQASLFSSQCPFLCSVVWTSCYFLSRRERIAPQGNK